MIIIINEINFIIIIISYLYLLYENISMYMYIGNAGEVIVNYGKGIYRIYYLKKFNL